jgi:hypothetical protein
LPSLWTWGRHYSSLDKKFEVHLFNSNPEVVSGDEENAAGQNIQIHIHDPGSIGNPGPLLAI